MGDFAWRYSLPMVVFVLVGCGGGGGGGPAPIVLPPSTPTLLSATNGQPAAALAFGATDTQALGDIGGVVVTGAVASDGLNFSLAKFARTQLLSIIKTAPQQTAMPAGLVIADTIACGPTPNFGSVSLTIDDLDGNRNTLSSGDHIQASFNNCVIDDSAALVRANGSLAITLNGVVGDPRIPTPLWSLDASMSFSALRVSDGVEAASVNGTIGFLLATQDNQTFTSRLTIAGSGLTTSISGPAGTLTEHVFALTLDYTENAATGAYEIDAFGTIGSTDPLINGTIGFDTTTPFRGIAPGFPSSGKLVVFGAAGSILSLTAINANTIDLDLGDDTINVVRLNWSDLS